MCGGGGKESFQHKFRLSMIMIIKGGHFDQGILNSKLPIRIAADNWFYDCPRLSWNFMTKRKVRVALVS